MPIFTIPSRRHLIRLSRNSAPRCVIDFYTRNGQFRTEAVIQPRAMRSLEGSSAERFNLSPSSALISCSTHKNRASPLGVFEIQLQDRPISSQENLQNLPLRGEKRRWRDILGKNDLVVIQTQRPPGPLEVIMIGLVSQRPTMSKSASPMGVQRSVSVVGQDMATLLSQTQIWYADELPAADPKAFVMRGLQIFATGFTIPVGTRGKRLKAIYEDAFLKLAKQQYPSFQSDPMASVGSDILLGYAFGFSELVPYTKEMITRGGTIWQNMQEIVDPPWHELFVDTIREEDVLSYFPDSDLGPEYQHHPQGIGEKSFGAYLIARRTPWSQAQWDKLPIYLFNNEPVKMVQLGGSPDVYTLFYAEPVETSLANVGRDIVDPAFIFTDEERDRVLLYGMNPKIVPFVGHRVFPDSTPLPGQIGPPAPAETNKKLVQRYSGLLKDWYGKNHEYWSGSITIQGTPAPRIGCLAGYRDEDDVCLEFYIDGVDHSFMALEAYDTTLTVSRGREVANYEI